MGPAKAHVDRTPGQSASPPSRTSSPARIAPTIAQLSVMLGKLTPEQLQFVELAAKISSGSAKKVAADAAAVVWGLIQEDTEHSGDLAIPKPKPSLPPKPSDLDPAIVAAGVIQTGPATAAALRDFATKLVVGPSHTVEALRALYQSPNPRLKELLEPFMRSGIR